MDSQKLKQLIELLKKISTTKQRVHIDVDYNGIDFRWTVPFRNMHASQFIPSEFKDENER